MILPTYTVVVEPRATGETRAITRHIAKSSPQGALTTLAGLLNAADSLGQLPHRYEVHQSRRDPALTVRSMPVPPHIVYYRVDDLNQTVRILSIRHGARRQPKRFK